MSAVGCLRSNLAVVDSESEQALYVFVSRFLLWSMNLLVEVR